RTSILDGQISTIGSAAALARKEPGVGGILEGSEQVGVAIRHRALVAESQPADHRGFPVEYKSAGHRGFPVEYKSADHRGFPAEYKVEGHKGQVTEPAAGRALPALGRDKQAVAPMLAALQWLAMVAQPWVH